MSSAGAAITGTRTTTSAYDDFGRLTSYSDGEGNTIGYAYDSSGNLQRLTYPGGFTVGYTYDDYNRMVGVLEWASPPDTVVPADPAPARTTTYTYDALGRVSTTTRANGTERKQTYDAASQLMAIEEKRISGDNPMIWVRSFRYDEAGRNGAFYLNDGEITHTHTWPSPSQWPQGLWYDPSSLPTVTYNEDNQLASFNAGTIDHDPDGNMLNYGGSVYGYDSRNRLTSAYSSNYRYNPDGLRVQITGTGATTYVVVDPNGLSRVLARTVGGTTTRYVWGLGLLHQITGSTVRYYHSDQVGSTVAITDGAGAVTDRFDYLPFGGFATTFGTTTTPFLYNGASGVETDDNGLLYMRARYYNSSMMRFINADPIRFEGGMNWYAYAGNNPMGYLDPAGTERISAAMAQSVVDYGMSVAQSAIRHQQKMQDRWESEAGQAARAMVPFVDAVAEYQMGNTDAAIRSATIETTMLATGGAAKLGGMASAGLKMGRAAENAGARVSFKMGGDGVGGLGSQTLVDDVMRYDLAKLKLSAYPTYNPKLSTLGRAEIRGVDMSSQVGPQAFTSRSELVGTIVHEEAHLRFGVRSTNWQNARISKWGSEEAYIQAVELRYLKMTGRIPK